MATSERKHENKILVNREIRTREVRLIAADGANLGIWPFFKALDRASEQDLDLVLINGAVNPPICKIVDAGKYKYEAKKKATEQARKARENRIDIKELQLRPVIDQHDLDIKIKKLQEWIADGDKVKIIMKFRGREMSNTQIGFDIINNMIESAPGAKLESKLELQGNRLTAVLFKGK